MVKIKKESHYEKKSNWPDSNTCHFYNLKEMTSDNKHIKTLYCIEWHEMCEIFQRRVAGKPVPITLWPTGKYKEGEFKRNFFN